MHVQITNGANKRGCRAHVEHSSVVDDLFMFGLIIGRWADQPDKKDKQMAYCVNGWNENFDDRTGERYYSCPECGYTEGSGHAKDCPRHPDYEDVED